MFTKKCLDLGPMMILEIYYGPDVSVLVDFCAGMGLSGILEIILK